MFYIFSNRIESIGIHTNSDITIGIGNNNNSRVDIDQKFGFGPLLKNTDLKTIGL